MHVSLLYRPSHALARCRLDPGEAVNAESGALVGMSTNTRVEAHDSGLLAGLKRMLGGEAFRQSTFTAEGGSGEVLFATPLSGDMAVLDVGERQWLVQSSGYVASTAGVALEPRAGAYRGFFSGAGLFVLATTGAGQMIIGAFGALESVPVDGALVVDAGHLAAWESTLTTRILRSTSGWLGSWLSGEAPVCQVEGRGQVWVQSRSASRYGAAVGGMLSPRQP